MILPDLIDLDRLSWHRDQGYVSVRRHYNRDLTIYNYTKKTEYSNHWNDVTENTRGLIVRDDGTIVARPWRKFYNFGQGPNIIDMYESVEVTDKKDGSLGILYFGDGWSIATRGSFVSDQAIEANSLWTEKYNHLSPPIDYTFLFEIVYPENRIILDHGETRDLILLGAVSIEYGYYIGPNEAASLLEWPGPVTEVFSFTTFHDAFSAPPRENAEGYVVRAGSKIVKLKQADYLELAKIASGLSPKSVHKHLMSGGTKEELLSKLPDEFHQMVIEWADNYTDQYNYHYFTAHNDYQALISLLPAKYDRKTFAKATGVYIHAHLLYLIHDNSPKLKEAIWKMVENSVSDDSRL